MGWFGMSNHVYHVLRTLGADQDEEGRFLIDSGVFTGLDSSEMVVSDDAHYYVNGEPRSLAHAMNSTSYGLRGVTVIS